MSRIGKLPVDIPEGVEISIDGYEVTVKGPKGELKNSFNPQISIKEEDNQIIVERLEEDKNASSLHGLTRSLISSMIDGVKEGFEKKLEMVGVGYNAQVKGKNLELEVGYSHPVVIEATGDIKFEVEGKNKIIVKGINKQLVGDVAAKIRDVRKPEPYKGKGIKYVGEHIRRKVGKTG